MAWSYSGDPASSELDEYRFLISDTDPDEPVLQNEEILYMLSMVTTHNARLSALFEAAANTFARQIKKSLGPQSEDPSGRLKYFQDKYSFYYKLTAASGLSLPVCTESSFTKGMHDNARKR